MSDVKHVDVHDNALLRAIPAATLRDVGVELGRATFAAGDVIFEEQSTGDRCYLVESGLVRISKARSDGSQETLGFIGPGEFFGELALFYSAPRSARATAVTATHVGELDAEGFLKLRAAAPLELTAAIGDAGLGHLRELHSTLVTQLSDCDRVQEIGLGVRALAHDMRSPLATIRMAADSILMYLAECGQETSFVAKNAEIIRRTADGALQGAEELLSRARGQLAPRRVSVSARDLVSEARERMRADVLQHKASFETVVESDRSIVCEQEEIVRALTNLVRNALEALPPDGGRVELRANVEKEGVLFTTVDTGCGIPLEDQGRIFERRFTRGKAAGTGLGLDHVRKVVERHGGRIAVDSEVGRGSVFRVWLPAEPPTSIDAGAALAARAD